MIVFWHVDFQHEVDGKEEIHWKLDNFPESPDFCLHMGFHYF